MSDEEVRAALRELIRGLAPGDLVPAGVVTLAFDEDAELSPGPGLVDLTVPQVAEALEKAPSTIRGYLLEGALDGYRLRGREWRITREALRGFQDRRGQAIAKPASGSGDDLSAWRRHRGDEGAA